MEISNKTLAWFVIGAVIVSLAGTIASFKAGTITGYVTSNDTGLTQVDVSQSVILKFAVNSTNFGSGSINSQGGYYYCNMWINGSSTINKYTGCTGFNDTNSGPDSFILQNIGTSYLNVTLNFTGNASTFIGGNASVASLRYAVSENASGSCPGTMYNYGWTEVGVPNTSTVICTNMSWQAGHNTLRVGMNITIPNDALSGSRSVTLIAQGTNI